MNRGLYTAATGMSAAQRMLDVTANNLANASTTGFKGDGLLFRDALEANMSAGGTPIGQMSFGVVSDGEFTDFSQGPMSSTGNPLDVAINDNKGAFKVETSNGQMYTRDGSFQLNDQKQLTDQQGNLVLDDSDNPITIDGTNVEIHNDGQIVVDGQSVARLGVFEGSFVKQGQNLFSATSSQPESDVSVKSKTLEGSNVNPVEAMVQMITLSRTFDMAQRAVQQHDELNQKLISVLNGQ